MRLLSSLLRRFIRHGTLRVRDVDGRIHVFGNRLPGPDVSIHLHDRKLYIRLFINPELYTAESYMDGSLTLENGAAIHDFLLLFSVNRAGLYSYGSQRLMRRVWRGLRRWHQANPIGLAAGGSDKSRLLLQADWIGSRAAVAMAVQRARRSRPGQRSALRRGTCGLC
jgi:cyclopropane-fatty-acyl-phospholipid synthase